MKNKKCCVCGIKVKRDNNGLFLQETFFTLDEDKKIKEILKEKKKLCIDCKKEMLFANILSIV